MKTVRSTRELERELARLRSRRPGPVGFVPTMGALHEGHLSLIRRARAETRHVVVSIFVNPLQFVRGEDLGRYPRTPRKDLALCRRAGADAVFMPPAADILRRGAIRRFRLPALVRGLCGPFRPGHFAGVASIVSRLFELVRPDLAYFGRKDYQQGRLVEWLARTHHPSVRVKLLPTVREKDGLAMSSRNRYLAHRERRRATALVRALRWGAARLKAGEAPAAIERGMRRRVEAAGMTADYLTIADAQTLEKVVKSSIPRSGAVLAGAVRLGKTRLIDNIEVRPRGRSSR